MRYNAVQLLTIFLVLLVSSSLRCQQSTTTDCSVFGNNAHCTSETTDNAAQQQRQFEQGQQVGQQLGQGIGTAMQAHRFKKTLKNYCAGHPGEDWSYTSYADGHTISSGHCPSEREQAVAAAGAFMARHKDFRNEPVNSNAMWAYIQTNNLDPRDEKSYERAYKNLKRSGHLELYAK